jgi:hypothetical protein
LYLKVTSEWQATIEALRARADRLVEWLREWVNDCYCQQDSLEHPEGCGRCENSLNAILEAAPPQKEADDAEAAGHIHSRFDNGDCINAACRRREGRE